MLMKITITEVIKRENKKIVQFKSSLGDGFGEWKLRSEPQELDSYFVELNVEDNLIWSENVKLAKNNEMLIRDTNDGVMILQGPIESIEDNGDRCFMRLEIDLFVFSCLNIPNHIQEYVKITARKVGVFDINL